LNPKITSIISTYCAAKFLPTQLDNLLKQTIADELEIIVVDSGSLENEGDIVSDYQKRHANIEYIRTERETLYGAWNRAVAAASGRYLINANTDDRLSASSYELLAAALDANPEVGLVYSDAWQTEDDYDILNFVDLTPLENWTLIETPEYSHKALLLKCFTGAFPMWRRSLHDQLGMFDPNFIVAGDYDFWLRIAEHVYFKRVAQPLALILESPDSILCRNKIKLFEENMTLRRKYFAAVSPGERL
jgi:O-antigen biosynthesis protein